MMLGDGQLPEQFLSNGWTVFIVVCSALANVVTVLVGLGWRRQQVDNFEGFVPASKEEFERHEDEDRNEHEKLHTRINDMDRGGNARTDGLIAKLEARMEVKFTELSSQDRVGREKTHDRINEVLRAVSRLEGRTGTGGAI